MPLLPPLPIFHSSSSSKLPYSWVVTRSSALVSLESTPPSTCHPAGNPSLFQPRHAGAPCSSMSECQEDSAAPAAAATDHPIPQASPTNTMVQSRLFMILLRSTSPMPRPRQTQLLEQCRRRAVKARERHIADVTQILASDGTGIKAPCGQVAVPRKETRRLLEGPGGAGLIADVVAYGMLSRRIEAGESLAEPPLRLLVQPLEAAEHDASVALKVGIGSAYPLIDEIDHAHRRGARRAIIGGDDEIRDDAGQPPLLRGQGERPGLAGTIILRQIRIAAVAVRVDAGGRGRWVGARGAGANQRPRRARGQHPFERGAAVEAHHSSLRFMRSRMWSEARHASAMMVSVGFLSAFEAKTAPSATNRLGTSQVCPQEFTTELLGSAPMMAPPTS